MSGDPVPTWRPSVGEIGSLLRTRTKDDVGNYLGTFTDATRPTDTEVDALIDQAVIDVEGLFTDDVPDTSFTLCRRAAAIRAAWHVEISFFTEQGTDNSPYIQLGKLADQAMNQVVRRAVWLDGLGEDPLPDDPAP